jgi:hypothetical protein
MVVLICLVLFERLVLNPVRVVLMNPVTTLADRDRRNVFQLCEGGRRRLSTYLASVDCAT